MWKCSQHGVVEIVIGVLVSSTGVRLCEQPHHIHASVRIGTALEIDGVILVVSLESVQPLHFIS